MFNFNLALVGNFLRFSDCFFVFFFSFCWMKDNFVMDENGLRMNLGWFAWMNSLWMNVMHLDNHRI